uniref:Uncharacterized protein n=1 Tax=Timema poppense TaxID=170557 RepID=A0A7R9DD58_TIMPO|nr:unnamed protein product [Timema poppensis]
MTIEMWFTRVGSPTQTAPGIAMLYTIHCCLALPNGRKRGLPIGACKHEKQSSSREPIENGVIFGADYSGEIVTDGSENMDCEAVQTVEGGWCNLCKCGGKIQWPTEQ